MLKTNKLDVLEGAARITYVGAPHGAAVFGTFTTTAGGFEKLDKEEVRVGAGLYVPKGYKLKFESPIILSYEDE